MKPWLNTHKKPLAIAAVILFISIAMWQSFSLQIARAFQASLLQRANQQINGQLQVGSVDLSALGWVRLRDVTLRDTQGKMLLKSPAVKISYRWSDLIGRSFGVSQIETVMLEEAEIWIKEKDARLNWDGLFKDDLSGDAGFRGKITFEKSVVHLETALLTKLLDSITGVVDFGKKPDLSVSLNAKLEGAPVNVAGNWGKGRPGELAVQAGPIDMVKLGLSLGDGADTRLEKGQIDQITVTWKSDGQAASIQTVQGRFSAVATSGKVEIREGRGKFSGDQTGLQFEEVALLAVGQQAQGQGSIKWKDGVSIIDFSFSLPDVDPAVVASGLSLQRPFAVQLRAVGPVSKPQLTGSFKAPQVNFSDMTITSTSGQFRYSEGRIILEQASGSANQGMLAAVGEVRAAGQSYELDVEGQGMDSTRLTDKDVQGSLDFSGHTSGQGENAVTTGSFVIHNGKAYGVPFVRLTGDFIKRGTATEVSGLAVQTAFGTFYPEQLSREALERINRQEIPVTSDELKKAVTGRVIQRILR